MRAEILELFEQFGGSSNLRLAAVRLAPIKGDKAATAAAIDELERENRKHWRWTNGEKFDYDNWADKHEPNNFGDFTCVELNLKHQKAEKTVSFCLRFRNDFCRSSL